MSEMVRTSRDTQQVILIIHERQNCLDRSALDARLLAPICRRDALPDRAELPAQISATELAI